MTEEQNSVSPEIDEEVVEDVEIYEEEPDFDAPQTTEDDLQDEEDSDA